MKQFRNLLFISTLLLCWVLVSCKTTRVSSSGWSLVWEENFNQKKSFDPQVWSKIPRGKADWNNYMTDFDSCFAMRKGKLVLRGIANQTLPNDTAPYLTGGVYTKGKKAFLDGRIEICAKLNAAKGAWPAIWLLPENAKWPSGGEIDVMERLNDDSIAYQTVHSHYTYTLGIKDHPKSHSTGVIHPDRYNVFAVEMYPDSLSFYVNDIHTFTYPRIQTQKEGQFPFDQPFYLLIDIHLRIAISIYSHTVTVFVRISPDSLNIAVTFDIQGRIPLHFKYGGISISWIGIRKRCRIDNIMAVQVDLNRFTALHD